MPMEGWVKCLSPQNTSGVLRVSLLRQNPTQLKSMVTYTSNPSGDAGRLVRGSLNAPRRKMSETFRLITWCRWACFKLNMNVGACRHLDDTTRAVRKNVMFSLLFYHVWRRNHHLLQCYWILLQSVLWTQTSASRWVDNECILYLLVNYPFNVICYLSSIVVVRLSFLPQNNKIYSDTSDFVCLKISLNFHYSQATSC